MAEKQSGKYIPRKNSTYIRGIGVVKKEDFTEDHYKAMCKLATKKRAHQQLEFVPDEPEAEEEEDDQGEPVTPPVDPPEDESGKEDPGKENPEKKGEGEPTHELPTDKWNNKRIEAWMAEKNIPVVEGATKKEMLASIVPAENWNADELRLWATMNNIMIDGIEDKDVFATLKTHIKVKE